jgi:hypothetical protein
MRFILFLGVLSIGLINDSAGARAYMMIGSGLDSCGAWTAHQIDYNKSGRVTLGSQAVLQEVGWVMGFLSGIGFIHANDDDPLKDMDLHGVVAWVSNYCRDHPIKNIGQAAVAFYFAHPR